MKVPYGNEICQSLIDLGINNEICNGVIRDFANPNTFDLNLIYNNLKYLSNFKLFFAIFFLHNLKLFANNSYFLQKCTRW